MRRFEKKRENTYWLKKIFIKVKILMYYYEKRSVKKQILVSPQSASIFCEI